MTLIPQNKDHEEVRTVKTNERERERERELKFGFECSKMCENARAI